ncbi:MAG: cysteine desulfurase [Chloroflexi bacterium]|nr:cysteine desulfurase [Chloroflexota bacterium]
MPGPHGFDIDSVRQQFPILDVEINGHPLVYLDSAATSQKPQVVIDAISNYYARSNSNVHRGVHTLSQQATDIYEETREKTRALINASDSREIIYVRGTTEAINLVASTYGRQNVGEGDDVIVTAMEHHSNIVPWQILCEEKGANLKVVPMDENGDLIMEEFDRLLSDRTKIVATVHLSNALGTINPVKEMFKKARTVGAATLLDGAQSAPHMAIDVKDIDCDFLAFSGHKLYGPTGIGILYGKYDLLSQMPPYQGGGEMIASVTFEKTIYAELPAKFEAGTPHIAGTAGLGAAIDFVNEIGLDNVAAHERTLLDYSIERIGSINGVKLIGNPKHRSGVISFVVDGVHPHDVGTVLDSQGIAIRAGHHCAQPVMAHFGIPATVRASFGMYNTTNEIDRLYEGVQQVFEVFG